MPGTGADERARQGHPASLEPSSPGHASPTGISLGRASERLHIGGFEELPTTSNTSSNCSNQPGRPDPCSGGIERTGCPTLGLELGVQGHEPQHHPMSTKHRAGSWEPRARSTEHRALNARHYGQGEVAHRRARSSNQDPRAGSTGAMANRAAAMHCNHQQNATHRQGPRHQDWTCGKVVNTMNSGVMQHAEQEECPMLLRNMHPHMLLRERHPITTRRTLLTRSHVAYRGAIGAKS